MTFLSKLSGTQYRLRRYLSVAAIACVLAPLPGSASAADAQPTAAPAAGPAMMHLLTAQQYRQIIEDTFGPDIEVNGRFTSETRRAALQRTGHCADATKNRAPTKLTVVQVVLRKFKELRDKWAQGAVPRAGSARDGRLQTCGRKGRSHGVRRPPNLTPRALEHQMH